MYPKGQMSHHFRKMREGDTLAVKGPRVHAIPVEKDNILNYGTMTLAHTIVSQTNLKTKWNVISVLISEVVAQARANFQVCLRC